MLRGSGGGASRDQRMPPSMAAVRQQGWRDAGAGPLLCTPALASSAGATPGSTGSRASGAASQRRCRRISGPGIGVRRCHPIVWSALSCDGRARQRPPPPRRGRRKARLAASPRGIEPGQTPVPADEGPTGVRGPRPTADRQMRTRWTRAGGRGVPSDELQPDLYAGSWPRSRTPKRRLRLSRASRIPEDRDGGTLRVPLAALARRAKATTAMAKGQMQEARDSSEVLADPHNQGARDSWRATCSAEAGRLAGRRARCWKGLRLDPPRPICACCWPGGHRQRRAAEGAGTGSPAASELAGNPGLLRHLGRTRPGAGSARPGVRSNMSSCCASSRIRGAGGNRARHGRGWSGGHRQRALGAIATPSCTATWAKPRPSGWNSGSPSSSP